MLCRRCRRRSHFDDTATLAREYTIYPHEVAPAKTADRYTLYTCFTQTFQRGFGSFEMLEAAVTLGSGVVIYVYHFLLILKILHEYRHRLYKPLRQPLPKTSARHIPFLTGTFLTFGHNFTSGYWLGCFELLGDTPTSRIRGDIGTFQSPAFVRIDYDRRDFTRNFPRSKETIQRVFRVFEVKEAPVAYLSV